MHDEARVQEMTGARKRQEKKMGKVKIEFQRSYSFEEVFVPVSDANTTTFLDYLRKFGFSEEKGDWSEEEMKIKNKQEKVIRFRTISDVKSAGGKIKNKE